MWLFLGLVVLNVVAYLWPDKANYAPHVASEKAEINPNYVRLNKEIEDEFFQRNTAAVVDAEKVIEPGGGIGGLQVDAQCYRVGPFVHEESFELGQAVLINESIDYKKAKRESKESNVFRVYMGPYKKRAEAIDMRTDLRRKKILDHFIRENSEGEYVVSLGIYTTQDSVDNAVRLFSEVLDDVKFDSELVKLPESYWLYFSLLKENEVSERLLQVDWGERAAKMGKFACQT